MSTSDQRARPSDQHEPGPSELKHETSPKIKLSLTQVVGGALAAMTAAFLGSRLSLAGTVAGAAMASIVAAVGSNLYTASLRSTHEKVRTVIRSRAAASEMPVTVGTAEDTFTWSDAQPDAARTPPPSPSGRGIQWRNIVLGALAAFALAAAVLTGLELISGHSLSGGKGTTITQVAEHKPAADSRRDPKGGATASPKPSAASPAKPSGSASTEPAAPQPTPSATASATATPSSPTPTSPTPLSTTTPDAGGNQAGAANQGAAPTG